MNIWEEYQKPILFFLMVNPFGIILSYVFPRVNLFVFTILILAGVLFIFYETTKIYLNGEERLSKQVADVPSLKVCKFQDILSQCKTSIYFTILFFLPVTFFHALKFNEWSYQNSLLIAVAINISIICILLSYQFLRNQLKGHIVYVGSRPKFFAGIFLGSYISLFLSPHINI